MRKKIIIIIIIIVFVSTICFIINRENEVNELYYYIKKQFYGEPINLETGLINNNFFQISKEGKDATKTRKGINEAIKYASEHNIGYIKLEKGKYLVDTFIYEINGSKYDRSIILLSNIEFDLNGSTVQIENNNRPNYRIFSILDAQNIKITNGVVIGDRYGHDYSPTDNGNTKHPWGMGVSILGGKNIEVSNLQIFDTTGDGIYISATQKKAPEDININNCKICNTRRQGITIITGYRIKIFNNEISNINGTAPQSGIDIERNYTYETSKDIEIYENKIYNLASNKAIITYDGITNVSIFENEIQGKIEINYPNNTIKVYNNKFIE